MDGCEVAFATQEFELLRMNNERVNDLIFLENKTINKDRLITSKTTFQSGQDLQKTEKMNSSLVGSKDGLF